MTRFATALRGALALVLLGLLALPAQAQITDVTVRQLNTLSPATIAALNAAGPSATSTDIANLLTNEWEGQNVRVTAVVLSDPRFSGLGTWNATLGRPNRIHVFIRDVAAETQGVEGMGIQIVDNTGAAGPLRVGDIVEVEGRLDIFRGGAVVGAVWQLTPLDATSVVVKGAVAPDSPLLAPVVVTTNDLNQVVQESAGEFLVQANWNNFSDLNGQYVRLEGAQITDRAEAPTGRPNWAFSTVGQDTRVGAADVSLRYRNDRGTSYQAPYFFRPTSEPFVPPPAGALANIQGFVLLNSFSPFGISQPQGTSFVVNPIRDADLEVTTSPPAVGLAGLTAVPGIADLQVSATIVTAGGLSLTSVTLNYDFSNGTTGSVGMTPGSGENQFVGTIPVTAAEDGAFLTYSVTATDNIGQTSTSASSTTRILSGGITRINHVQQTRGEIRGPSPFAGINTTMNIEAVVMTQPSTTGFISIQDDPALAPWSGVFVVSSAIQAAANLGDRIRITQATIQENFALTRLLVPDNGFQILTAGEPYGPVTGVPTGLLAQDPDLAEAHEGMFLRFENVTITSNNPDAPSNFGEWAFSSSGPENAIRGDDEALDVPGGSTMFEVGQWVNVMQGIWSYAFNNYKLWPRSMADLEFNVSTEDGTPAHALGLATAYPNPVRGQATVAFTLDQPGTARVELYDVTGRRVALLADGEHASGVHRAALDASGLASGVYLVRLTAGGEVRTTRLVVAH